VKRIAAALAAPGARPTFRDFPSFTNLSPRVEAIQ
jgi:hypothetical protein